MRYAESMTDPAHLLPGGACFGTLRRSLTATLRPWLVDIYLRSGEWIDSTGWHSTPEGALRAAHLWAIYGPTARPRVEQSAPPPLTPGERAELSRVRAELRVRVREIRRVRSGLRRRLGKRS